MEVLACDDCREILGQSVEFEMPTINPQDVYDAENETLEVEFADGWLMFAFPAVDDPIAITTRHRCPGCQERRE